MKTVAMISVLLLATMCTAQSQPKSKEDVQTRQLGYVLPAPAPGASACFALRVITVPPSEKLQPYSPARLRQTTCTPARNFHALFVPETILPREPLRIDGTDRKPR